MLIGIASAVAPTLSNVKLNSTYHGIVYNKNTTDENLTVSYTATGQTSVVTDYRRYAHPSGLVSWWPFTGNANDAIGTNHGTISGATAVSTGPVPGFTGAYSLDGVNDYISFGNSDQLRLRKKNITVAFWFNTKTGCTPYMPIFGQNYGGTTWGAWRIRSDSTCSNYYLTLQENSSKQYEFATYRIAITNDTWVFGAVTLTFTGSGYSASVYRNGVLVGTQSNTVNFDFNSDKEIYLGASSASNKVALVDEPMVFSRALSASEVKSLYNRRFGGSSIAVLNLPFSLNSSSTAKDYSTNAASGTVTGATWSNVRGGSYNFDGVNDYIGVTAFLDGWDNPSRNTTINFWMRSNKYGSGITQRAMGKRQSGGIGWYITAQTVSPYSKISFNLQNNTGTSSISSNVYILNDTTHFHMVTMVKRKTNMSLYVDGVYQSSMTTRPNFDSTTDFTIGAGTEGGINSLFNGSIDDVLVFNTSISSSEIAALYSAGLQNKSLEVLPDSFTTTGDYWSANVTATNRTAAVSTLSPILKIISCAATWQNTTWTWTNTTCAANDHYWTNATYIRYDSYSCPLSTNTTYHVNTQRNCTYLHTPVISVVSPANMYETPNRWITLSTIFIDAVNTTATARCYLNNTLIATNTSMRNNMAWTINVTSLDEKQYSWYCNVTDGRYSSATTPRAFIVYNPETRITGGNSGATTEQKQATEAAAAVIKSPPTKNVMYNDAKNYVKTHPLPFLIIGAALFTAAIMLLISKKKG